MKLSLRSCLLFAAIVICIAGVAKTLAAQEPAREFGVTVEPELIEHGIHAAVAAVPPASAQDPAAPIVIIFITYEKPFQGELYVRGFTKDGVEIARSQFLAVKEEAESGGHARFTFDKDTNIHQAGAFILAGRVKAVSSSPKKESFGEAAENIVKELLQ